MKTLLFAGFLLALVFPAASSQARAAVPIDVTSLTILKPRINSSQISLSANGLPAPYQSPLTGGGGGVFWGLEGCWPCHLGSVFRADFGWDGGSFLPGFNISGYGNNKEVRFYLTGTTGALSLSPAIRIRSRTVLATAPAEVVGRIEVYDGNTMIAYDDDVRLSGKATAQFGQYWGTGSPAYRRTFDFSSVLFELAQTTP